MKRATKITLVRGCFYAIDPNDLRRFGDTVANAFAGSIVIGDILPNREGDYRLYIKVFLREVILNE